MQCGRIFRKGPSWFLQYRETVLENGLPVRRHVCKKLAPFCDAYRSSASVRPLAAEILGPINAGAARPESTQTVRDFIELSYLPHVHENLRPSTYKGYRDIFRCHLRENLANVRLRDFRCAHGDRILAAIAHQSGLSRASLRHVKAFLSGAFKFAKRKGFLDINPMVDAGIPKAAPGVETHAYSLEEVQAMLRALPEPARTVVALAAFTGLRLSELRGLRWEDFTGDEIRVTRTVWRTYSGEPKTRASAAPVPVLPFLCRVLAEHRKNNPGEGYIFAGTTGAPLNLDNLARRMIRPMLGRAWHGWHAFRRGLATNLNRVGTPVRTIQAILRHASAATTMAAYIKPVAADSHAAMLRLEETLANEWQTLPRAARPN